MPGVIVEDRTRSTPASAPTDTSQWLVAGLTERGPTSPVRIASLSDYRSVFGDRISSSPLPDAIEAFFQEGGGVAWVSRVLGPSPVASSVALQDSVPATAITVSAADPGAWGDGLSVAIVAGQGGGTFALVVTRGGQELERSPDLADPAAAEAWGDAARWVRVAAGAGGNPVVVSATSLAGGTDDAGNITDDAWAIALGRLGRDLGPGQVSAPGRTTGTGHQQLLAHAAAHNRVALLDGIDTAVVGTLTAAAQSLASLDDARFGGLFAPWARAPGITPGTSRAIPPSALVAGLIGRNEAAGVSVAQPPAGVHGVARWVTGPSQQWTDAERAVLNQAAVNVIRPVYGETRLYGFRSLEPASRGRWWQLSAGRLRMQIEAEARAIGERYVMRQVDGRGRVLADLAGELTGVMLGLHQAGAVHGLTPEDAFRVTADSGLNPPSEIAAGRLHAEIAFRPSPFAEWVAVGLVFVPITESI